MASSAFRVKCCSSSVVLFLLSESVPKPVLEKEYKRMRNARLLSYLSSEIFQDPVESEATEDAIFQSIQLKRQRVLSDLRSPDTLSGEAVVDFIFHG